MQVLRLATCVGTRRLARFPLASRYSDLWVFAVATALDRKAEYGKCGTNRGKNERERGKEEDSIESYYLHIRSAPWIVSIETLSLSICYGVPVKSWRDTDLRREVTDRWN